MPHDVFISYSSHDKAVADAMCAALEAQEIRCWIAPRDIPPGTEWGEATVSAIEGCRVMVLVLSRSANESAQVRRELEYSVSKRKIIVPFRIEGVLPSREMEFCLGNISWLDATTPPLKAHLERLCNEVKVFLRRSNIAAGVAQCASQPPASSTQNETLTPLASVVLPRPLFIKTERMVALMEEGIPLPARRQLRLRRAFSGPSIDIPIYLENEQVGTICVEDIPNEAGEGCQVVIDLEVAESNEMYGKVLVYGPDDKTVVKECTVRVSFPPVVIPELAQLLGKFDELKDRLEMEILHTRTQDRPRLAGAGKAKVRQIQEIAEGQSPDRQVLFELIKELDRIVQPPADDMDPPRREFENLLAECREMLASITDDSALNVCESQLIRIDAAGKDAAGTRDQKKWTNANEALQKFRASIERLIRPSCAAAPSIPPPLVLKAQAFRMIEELRSSLKTARESRMRQHGAERWLAHFEECEHSINQMASGIAKISDNAPSEQALTQIQSSLRTHDTIRNKIQRIASGAQLMDADAGPAEHVDGDELEMPSAVGREHAQRLNESREFLERAKGAMERGEFSDALPLLNEASKRSPDSSVVYFLRCQVHMALGDFTEARKDVKAFAELAESKEEHEAAQRLNETIAQSDLRRQALEAFNRMDFPAASRLLRSALKQCPATEREQVAKDLAVILTVWSVTAVNEALESRSAPMQKLRTICLESLGRLQEASSLAPDDRSVRENLNSLLRLISQTDESLELARKTPGERSQVTSSVPSESVLSPEASKGWFGRLLGRLRGKKVLPGATGSKSSPAGKRPSTGQGESGADSIGTPSAHPKRDEKTPEVPGGVADRVHFSVTAPPSMAPGTSHVIDVWAHLEQQRQEVISRARVAAVDGDVIIKSKGPVRVMRGTVITVRLRLPGFVVEPEESTILWEGEIGTTQFSARVPEGMPTGKCQGHAVFLIDGLPITKLLFEIRIASSSAAPDRLATKVERYRAVFASYASRDANAVLARIQGLRIGRPDMDVFFAEAHIQPGEQWQDRLRQEIIARDALYLFWSQAASVSEHVDWEWRCALKEHGIEFIDPIPLVHPKEVPPPPELAALHFNDWVLAYMSGQPVIREPDNRTI